MNNDSGDVYFKPYVGDNYKKGFASGKKLLLLGESSFFPKNKDPARYLADKNMIADYIDDDIREHWIEKKELGNCFVGRLHRLLTDKDNPSIDENREAWDRVAFINYIPIFAGDGIDQHSGRGADARKSARHWNLAAERLPCVLNELQPDRVLVLGKTVWNRISQPGKYVENQEGWCACGDERKRGLWDFSANGQSPALATWVYHPSWGRDSWERMRNVLDRLIEFSP